MTRRCLEVEPALLAKVGLALRDSGDFNSPLRDTLQASSVAPRPGASAAASKCWPPLLVVPIPAYCCDPAIARLRDYSFTCGTDDSGSDTGGDMDTAPATPDPHNHPPTTLFDTTATTNPACAPEEGAFFVSDLGELSRRHRAWRALLPRVDPWYAVKCNPARPIVTTLASLGAGMDCASAREMQLAMSVGVPPSRIIFANPCKRASHLRAARDAGIQLMTFDNPDELDKIAQVHPAARLLLRLRVDDSHATWRLGEKFGASLADAPALFARAKSLGLCVEGVAFHVGSGCHDVSAFPPAVALARKAFDAAAAAGLPPLRLLDCGGGFPGVDCDAVSFAAIAAALGGALEDHFPEGSGVHIIAEPGRYFVSAMATLLTQVHSRRVCGGGAPQQQEQEQPACSAAAGEVARVMYYLDDGVYGSLNCILFDHYDPLPLLLTRQGKLYHDDSSSGNGGGASGSSGSGSGGGGGVSGSSDSGSGGGGDQPRLLSNLWGPTCDSIDCVAKGLALPELAVGDWLVWPNVGAYAGAVVNDFNFMYETRTLYIDTNA